MLRDVMHAFFELIGHGFTTFDCGDIYTGVEEFLGTLVARLKHGEGPVSADDIQIHTKYVPDLDILTDVTFKHTESIIDRSLRRLNRDALAGEIPPGARGFRRVRGISEAARAA